MSCPTVWKRPSQPSGRCHRRYRQPDQPASGSRADLGHPARDGCTGRGHAQALPQDGHRAEDRRGRAPRAAGSHGAGGRSQPLSRAAEELAGAAAATEEPGPAPCRHPRFRGGPEGAERTLDFDDPGRDRVAAYFHTGGTTGMPKVAQHRYDGMVYNGWIGHRLLFTEEDNALSAPCRCSTSSPATSS